MSKGFIREWVSLCKSRKINLKIIFKSWNFILPYAISSVVGLKFVQLLLNELTVSE